MDSTFIEGYSCIWLCSTLPSQREEDILYLVNTGTTLQVYTQVNQTPGISLTKVQSEAFYALEEVTAFPALGQPSVEIRWKQNHKLADAISLIVGHDPLEAFSHWGAQISDQLRSLMATGTTAEAEEFLKTSLKTFTKRYKQLSLIYHPDKSTAAEKLAHEEKSKQLFHLRDALKARWEAIIRGKPQFSSYREELQRVHDELVDVIRLQKILLASMERLDKKREAWHARAEEEFKELRRLLDNVKAQRRENYGININKEPLLALEAKDTEINFPVEAAASTLVSLGIPNSPEKALEPQRPIVAALQTTMSPVPEFPENPVTLPREASRSVSAASVEEDANTYTRPRTDDWYRFQQELKHFIEMLKAFKNHLASLLEDIKLYFQAPPTEEEPVETAKEDSSKELAASIEARVTEGLYPSKQSFFQPVPKSPQPELEQDKDIGLKLTIP